MNILKNKYLFWLFLILPALFVFKNLILGNLFYGGDAPFFYSGVLSKLFSEPLVWTERGYSFGGINLALWLSPMMLVYGAIAKFFYLDNDAILRILFFIPSILLSFIGPYFLTKYLKLGKVVQFFTSLVYIFNTYYLLLLDGGQVGVALAYGIFPVTLLFLKKFVDEKSKNNFLFAVFFTALISIIDPRIALVCFLTIFLWSLLEKKFTLWLIFLGLLLIPLNLYWLYPLIKVGSGGVGNSISGLGLLSFINPLMLFSPHWPANIFGKVSYPAFYFAIVPILIFGGLLKKNTKQTLIYAILFLVFTYLVKGETPPLGINLGFIFRDSSKFFIPVILFAGFLIGNTMDQLKNYWLRFAGYLFILILILPAFLGKMNFMLSNNMVDQSYQKIANKLSVEEENYRTVWFTNKNPLSFESLVNPAIDAISLTDFWPLAQMNASEDVFNYLNNKDFVNWFRILGIKYIFLNGDARNINPSETDLKNWQTINNLISNNQNLKKLDWGLDFPVYEIAKPYPKFYAVDSLVAVVGSGLDNNNVFVPSIYFEDGKWDPATIIDKNPDSLKIYFNHGEKLDLTMSLLQKYFISPSKSKTSEWSIFNKSEYLKYKYQLLIRGYKYSDFDYGKGIAFSTNKDELIIFKFNVPQSGDYLLAKRTADKNNQKFIWQTEEKYLKKGKFDYLITNNNDDILVLNTVALIPKKDYQEALTSTNGLLDKFETITSIVDTGEIEKIDIKNLETSKYWIIMSDNYNSNWKLMNKVNNYPSVPVYSMLNAFYVDPTWGGISIEFTGQKVFRWGIWGSIIAILILIICFLHNKNDQEN